MGEARPHLGETLAGLGQLALLGEDADAFAGDVPIGLGVGGMRPDQQLAAPELLVLTGPQEPQELLDEPSLVGGDAPRRAEVKQDAPVRVEAQLAAEGLAAGDVGGGVEPFVEEGRSGDLDPLARDPMDLGGVLEMVLVPGEQTVGSDLDQRLGGEIVPAQHRQGGRHAQPPGGLHIVGLFRKAQVQRTDQDDLRIAGADELQDSRIRRRGGFGELQRQLRRRRGQQRPEQAALGALEPGLVQISAPALDVVGRGLTAGQVAAVGA